MRSVRLVPPDDDLSPDDERPDGAGPNDTDATNTILVETEDGERFALTVDDALRVAVSGLSNAGTPADEESTPVTIQSPPVPSGPPLSPRDIQVRVRGGESPEDLAADSGTPIDKIMRFAGPVLHERARVGDEARRSRARRDGDGALVPFGETVDRRFLAHGIDPAAVGWDSFRRPDGSWVIIASWLTGDHERHAHWAFSLAARTVLPADEVGADLLSDRPLRPVVRAVPDPDDETAEEFTETSRDAVYDQEAPTLYPPAPPYVPAAAPSRHEAPPLPLRLADPLPTAEPAGSVDAADDGEEGTNAEATTGSIAFTELFETTAEPAPAEPERRARPRGKSAREQTKIPSWDDILLGVRRKQD